MDEIGILLALLEDDIGRLKFSKEQKFIIYTIIIDEMKKKGLIEEITNDN